MKNNGFTLIELLVTILLIALISGLCVVTYNHLLNRNNPLFYQAIEENVELAANDYIFDHRDKSPTEDELKEISLGDLENGQYVEKVIDVNGNKCNGKIVVFRENKKIKYEVCLDCGEYKSSGQHCK